MDRLSIVLTLMTGAVLTGTLTIAMFTLGFYAWPAVIVSAGIGFLASWPLAYLISRWIKRADPHWNEKDEAKARGIPQPASPEV